MIQAWIADDDDSIRWVLERALEQKGISARSFSGGQAVLEAMETDAPDVLFTDIRMPGLSGYDLIEQLHVGQPELPVIIMTAHSDLDSAVSAFQGGAFDYLPKPFDLDDAVELARRAARPRPVQQNPSKQSSEQYDIIGRAPAMQALFRVIGRLSGSSITALITGESGTGKELVAKALHEHSPRAGAPFVAVNTAAIPKDLMESEFFGHEKGAFTGAAGQRRGRFEQASGGSLFLDEIGEMPVDLQTRLLRVLQDGSFYRVGGHTAVTVDVRVLAATNRDLEAEVAAGRFREDLYHRLNVIRLRVPPLRERRDDIPALLDHFLQRAAAELATRSKTLDVAVRTFLTRRDWPGNVRQLENECRWLTAMSPGDEIVMDDLPAEIRNVQSAVENAAFGDGGGQAGTSVVWDASLAEWAALQLADGRQDLLDEALPRFECAMIRAALDQAGGHRQQAARLLGWGRNTLARKIKALGLDT